MANVDGLVMHFCENYLQFIVHFLKKFETYLQFIVHFLKKLENYPLFIVDFL